MSGWVETLTAKPELANAIATIASVFVSMAALVVSGIALFYARRTLHIQHQQVVLSVKPLAMLSTIDDEGNIEITLHNNGVGPLIVKSIVVMRGDEKRSYLRQWMPALPESLAWQSFVGPVKNKSLAPGAAIRLLHLKGDPTDKLFSRFRDQCRLELASLEVVIEQTDIYGSDLRPHAEDLSWYGREHIAEGPACAPVPAGEPL